MAEIAVITETGRHPLRLAILARRPDSLRIEAIPALGPPNFFLAAHDGRLAAYLPETGEYLAGPAVPENLARFFPLSLSVGDLISLLMGNPPAWPTEEAPRVDAVAEAGMLRLDISSRDRRFRQTLWIDEKTGYPRRCEQTAERDGGTETLNVYFDAYAPVDGAPMPRRIRVKVKGGDQEERTVVLEYESATLETTSDAGAGPFDLPVPPGATVRRLE